jgi:hypothetical protein
MHDAIDITHISILKPLGPFLKDYYYHELHGCNIIVQKVVDCNKQFTNLFVGFLGNVHDS